MHAIAALALAVVASVTSSGPLAAQADSVEHWLITSSVVGRADSAILHVRIRWAGDSLLGNVDRRQRVVGSARGSDVQLRVEIDGLPVQAIHATRRIPGQMTGTWSSLDQSGRSGAWRADRIVSATTLAEMKAGRFERWTISRPTFDGDSIPRHLRLLWRADSLIGLIGPDSGVLAGAVHGDQVTLLWMNNDGFALRFTGTRTGPGEMRGPFSPGSGPQRGTWRAKRDEAPRPGRTVTSAPTGTIANSSAANGPALHIRSGDTVRVQGARGGAVAPVYVDGAYRGDVLAVQILKVRPFPARAFSGNRLDLNWFTPMFVRDVRDPPFNPITWALDTIAGVARLDPPLPRLGALTIPLRPHIGMIGVAPAATSVIDAGEEGAHGGNLDFSGLGEGVTVYLPVFHAGALLSVGGDVHAAQGDGEISHNGLESFANIEVTVTVLEGRGLSWMRAEDSTHLMAFGSSEDLNAALRLAATHLAQWLKADYRLDDRELAALLGSALELRIANVFGQQRTIVAQMRKALLPVPVH